MLNVGLTGGIASGKSTVAQMFVRLGGYLIDFDKLAHEVQEPEKPAWRDVVNYFGPEILRADRTIDRNQLAKIVFNDPEKIQALNAMVHPCVYAQWHNHLEQIQALDSQAIIFSDVPLLFEGHKQDLFDVTILVMTNPEMQIDRLMARNALSCTDAQLRLDRQMPIHDKICLADIVIDNSCAVAETEKKVAGVWRNLLEREKNKRK